MVLHDALEAVRGAARRSLSLPPRPPTAQSVLDVRQAVVAQQVAEAAAVGDLSRTLYILQEIPDQWALNYLQRYRTVLSELGCWMSNTQPAHETGYIKINLRNTTIRHRPGPLGIQPWAHQLAVVAGGNKDLLPLTSPTRSAESRHEISHLCHNPRCFSPSHVVVEPAALNRARNDCRRARMVRLRGLVHWNPCSHWDDAAFYGGVGGQRRSCILQEVELGGECRGRYMELRADGSTRARPGAVVN